MKCLGVLLDDGLTWTEQVQSVRKWCFAGLAKLRSLKDVLPPDIKKKVYNALVLPHSDYCSVVWQECTKDLRMKIERVQNYGMKDTHTHERPTDDSTSSLMKPTFFL